MNKLLPSIREFCEFYSKTKNIRTGADYIYVLYVEERGLVKIGKTNSLWKRLGTIEGMNHSRTTPIMFWNCHNGRSVEAGLHAMFKDYREQGEWFYFGDYLKNTGDWKYRHLAVYAILTASYLPIPVDDSLYETIQYGHTRHHVPSYDWKSADNLKGEEIYPYELFARFHIKGDKSIITYEWPKEIVDLYCLSDPEEKEGSR